MAPIRRKRTSKNQFEIIINYLEENKDLFSYEKSAGAYNKIEKKWTNLTEQLNSVKGGPQKSAKEWKNVISEWKTNVRKKARDLNEAIRGTGGGPNNNKALTDIEERLLSLIKIITIEGAPNVPEPGINDITNELQLEDDGQMSAETFLIDDIRNEQQWYPDGITNENISENYDVIAIEPEVSNLLIKTLPSTESVLESETTKQNKPKRKFNELNPSHKTKKPTRISNNHIENVLRTHSEHLHMLVESNKNIVESNNNIAESIRYFANSVTDSINKAIIELKK